MTDEDITFLQNALQDAKDGQQYVARNPQFHALGSQIVQLYGDIIRKATENEKGS
jgi:pyrimidine deaminase RibD-like protein